MSGPAINYILLVIPAVFSVVVIAQGLYKISREEKDGPTIFIFGAIFLTLVFATYWFFIK